MKNYDESVKKCVNVLLNLIKDQWLHFDKVCLYVKDPLEQKYQMFINEKEKLGI